MRKEKIITPEEFSLICVRVAVGDATFLLKLLAAAENAGDELLPGDLEKLEEWVKKVHTLRDNIVWIRTNCQ